MKPVNKDEIVAAMSGKIPQECAEQAADILCGSSPPSVAVIDDEDLSLPDDGSTKDRPVITSSEELSEAFDIKVMLALPARIFVTKWLREQIRRDFGLLGSNAFYAAAFDAGHGACEVLLLAAILKEAYGKTDLKDLMDRTVFSRTDYAPFRTCAEPILEKYIY